MGLAGGLATNGTGAGGSGGGDSARFTLRNLKYSGILGQNWDLVSGTTAGMALNTQKVFGSLVGLLAGDTVNNVYVCVSQAAAGTTPTGLYLGLYDKTGVQLAVSANLNAQSGWLTAGVQGYAMGTPYLVPTSDVYYMVVLSNGSFGTTPLNIVHGPQTAIATIPAGFSHSLSVSQTAQATPPAPATFAAAVDNVWFGWS